VMGCVAVVAFAKVASVGTAHIDRGAMRMFALATAVSATTGGLAPLFADFPYITTAQLSVPVACVLVGVAADRCFETGETVRIADLVRGVPAPDYPRMPGRTAPVPMPVKI